MGFLFRLTLRRHRSSIDAMTPVCSSRQLRIASMAGPRTTCRPVSSGTRGITSHAESAAFTCSKTVRSRPSASTPPNATQRGQRSRLPCWPTQLRMYGAWSSGPKRASLEKRRRTHTRKSMIELRPRSLRARCRGKCLPHREKASTAKQGAAHDACRLCPRGANRAGRCCPAVRARFGNGGGGDHVGMCCRVQAAEGSGSEFGVREPRLPLIGVT